MRWSLCRSTGGAQHREMNGKIKQKLSEFRLVQEREDPMLFAANVRQLMGEHLGVPLIDQVGILFKNAWCAVRACAVHAVRVLRVGWVVGFRGWGWRVGRCKCVGWGWGLKGWELAPGMKVFNAENAG